jgi:hypothetical protein
MQQEDCAIPSGLSASISFPTPGGAEGDLRHPAVVQSEAIRIRPLRGRGQSRIPCFARLQPNDATKREPESQTALNPLSDRSAA